MAALTLLQGGVANEGRPPPHDIEAEGAVLGTLLIDAAGLDDTLAMLAAQDFYAEAHRRIFEAIAGLHEARTPVDIMTVQSRLRAAGRLDQVGGTAYLIDLGNSVPALGEKRLAHHARTVKDLATQRAVLARCQRAGAELYAGIGDTRAFLDAFEQDIFALVGESLGGGAAERISQASARLIRRMMAKERPPAIPTGFVTYDRITGGLKPKALTIVGGLTSMGKSVFGMNVAVNVAKSRTGVLVCSLEMTADELVERSACSLAGISAEKVRERELSQTEYGRYLAAHGEIGKLHLYIADEPGQGVGAVRAKGRRLAAKLARESEPIALGLVVVDYLQLLKPGAAAKNRTREQEVAELSRNLKGIAKDLDVHVLALCQLNGQHESRKGDDKRPRLGDLRESKAIAQDADVVAFVHRPEYQAERDDRAGKTNDRQLAEIIVAKHRNGRTGTAELLFDRTRCRFENLPDGHFARDQ